MLFGGWFLPLCLHCCYSLQSLNVLCIPWVMGVGNASLTYTSVDQVDATITTVGWGTLLAKIDIEAAYWLIPVHPDDRCLQAVEWESSIYIDPTLPFGLRSAPKIINAVADALAWQLRQVGIAHVDHYLDNFIVLGSPSTTQCQHAVTILNRELIRLWVPIADHKRDGSAICLTFLGIEIDTVALQLRLPENKLQCLCTLLGEWSTKKQKELESLSLCGLLNHACKVVRAGRSFYTCHPPRGKTPFRLKCWVSVWPSMVADVCPNMERLVLPFPTTPSPREGIRIWHLTFLGMRGMAQVGMGPTTMGQPLIPTVNCREGANSDHIGMCTRGRSWYGQHIQCRCDNQVVVAGVRSRKSKMKGIMHLLRCLVFIEAIHNFHLSAHYIDTRSNHLADNLSHNLQSSFLHKVPQADQTSTSIKQPLLLDSQADWTSPTWMEDSVQFYFQQGLVPSTQKAYQAATRRFHNFCMKYNLMNPFPVTEKLLCSLIAFLANEGLAPQTCKSYLAAVRNVQLSLGLPDPREQSSLPVLKRVQAGISRARMLKGAQARIRLPITIHILEKLFDQHMASSNPERVVIWAVPSIVFFGFFI